MAEKPFKVPTYQPKPKLFDKSIQELERSSCDPGDEYCITFMVEVPKGCNAVEVLLTHAELGRLARWCAWEPVKYPPKR